MTNLAPAPAFPDAACATHPQPSWWTPRRADSEEAEAAAHVCRRCPALAACADWAARHKPRAGIWAGEFHGGPGMSWLCAHCLRWADDDTACGHCGRDEEYRPPRRGTT